MRTLRMHLSEWDYQRCKNSLMAERFCIRVFSVEAGEEMLICLEKPLVDSPVSIGGKLDAILIESEEPEEPE